MAISKLTEISDQHTSAKIASFTKQSGQWLLNKISSLRSIAAIPNTIAREQFRKTNRLIKGRLYMFYYNPIGKDDLPYYDKFPLVLMLEKYPEGFLGLNLHYLPLRYRIAFLGKLIRYALHNEDGDIQRLRITYDILCASKRLREFQPCLKQYLFGQIRSKILMVQPDEWEVACYLPLQQFKKARQGKVWQESLNVIRHPHNSVGTVRVAGEENGR